jgi:hypothetical protein
MKYYSYNEYTGQEYPEIVTLSEMQILDLYWDFWKQKMIKKYGEKKFLKYSEYDCIDDWVVTNWAWESNIFPSKA